MKKLLNLSILFLCLFALFAFPVTVHAAGPADGGPDEGKLIIGDTYILTSDQVLNDNLIVIGGRLELQEGSEVNGDVTLVGGVGDISGTISGNLAVLGATMTLQETAVVNGDFSHAGSLINKDGGAEISGSTTEGEFPYNFSFGNNHSDIQIPDTTINDNTYGWDRVYRDMIGTAGNIVGGFFQILAFGAVALVLGLLMPKPIERAAASLIRQPLAAFGIGLLTILFFPLLFVLLCVTILLIPVALLAVVVLVLAFIYGWVIVGFELGNRLAELFKTTWSVPLAAGVGTLVLSLFSGLIALIPCVGWLVGFLASIIGLGAVIMSRFGSVTFGDAPAAPRTPRAPVSPVAPVAPVVDVTPIKPQAEVVQTAPAEAQTVEVHTVEPVVVPDFDSSEEIMPWEKPDTAAEMKDSEDTNSADK